MISIILLPKIVQKEINGCENEKYKKIKNY